MSVLLLCLASALLPAAAADTAGPPSPTVDPFYVYAGASPLSSIAPGTVLKTRTVPYGFAGINVPVTMTQVLYRTSGVSNRPTVTVATIFKPLFGTVTKLVSYQSPYDSISPRCEPSYTMRGGGPVAQNAYTSADLTMFGALLAQGHAVVTADYEGADQELLAMPVEAHGVLDGVRAAEHALNLPHTTPVGYLGYSGGGVATQAAAQYAPSYAPELNAVGYAVGAAPVQGAHTLAYINGSSSVSGIAGLYGTADGAGVIDWPVGIPIMINVIQRIYGQDQLAPYLNSYGRQVVQEVADACLTEVAVKYPGLTYQSMLKAPYQNIYRLPSFVRAINTLLVAAPPTSPHVPMFFGLGKADNVGDGIAIVRDTQQLAYEYCRRGAPVQYTVYPLANHFAALPPWVSEATQFISARLDGQPAVSDCASITPGSSIAPLPMPSVDLTWAGFNATQHGYVAYLRLRAGGTLPSISVTLSQGSRQVARFVVPHLTHAYSRAVLRTSSGRALPAGRYTVRVTSTGVTLDKRAISVR
ncbi:MAG: lipase family protein [Marmoricola sp.]